MLFAVLLVAVVSVDDLVQTNQDERSRAVYVKDSSLKKTEAPVLLNLTGAMVNIN